MAKLIIDRAGLWLEMGGGLVGRREGPFDVMEAVRDLEQARLRMDTTGQTTEIELKRPEPVEFRPRVA